MNFRTDMYTKIELLIIPQLNLTNYCILLKEEVASRLPTTLREPFNVLAKQEFDRSRPTEHVLAVVRLPAANIRRSARTRRKHAAHLARA